MLGSKYIRGLLTIYGFFFFVFSGVFLSSLFPKNNLAIVCSLLFTLVLIPVIEVWGNIFWWLIGVLITVTSISGIYIVSKLKYWPQKKLMITIFLYFFMTFLFNVLRVDWGSF